MADSTLHRPSLAADLPLVVGVIGTICVAFGLALYHPALAFVPIAALVAAPLLVWLFRRPLLNVAVFLGGFVLIVSHGDDFSIGEVLYGLYWMLFMVHWGVTRVIVYREPILGDVVSKALFLFLLTLLLSSPLALVFGTPFGDMVSQLRAVAMIATFFPVREAVARYDGALPLLLWVLIGTWCFVALRNLFSYQTIIANAVQSYQVGRGRVIMNDDILMSASTCLTAWVLFAKQWRQRVTLMLAFLLCFAALLLTQSRSYWVSYALTVGVLFALSPPRTRVALLIAIGMSILAFGAAAQILLGDKFTVMLAGFIQRFSSIAESGSQDISLLSRVYEAQGALSDFVFNPIIGHGPGTEFTHWNIIDHGTRHVQLHPQRLRVAPLQTRCNRIRPDPDGLDRCHRRRTARVLQPFGDGDNARRRNRCRCRTHWVSAVVAYGSAVHA